MRLENVLGQARLTADGFDRAADEEAHKLLETLPLPVARAMDEEIKRRAAEVEEMEKLRSLWPHALVKSVQDPYVYALGLRDGTVIRYTQAHATGNPEWVEIDPLDLRVDGPLGRHFAIPHGTGDPDGDPHTTTFLARGLSIRVADIVWVVDGYK